MNELKNYEVEVNFLGMKRNGVKIYFLSRFRTQ